MSTRIKNIQKTRVYEGWATFDKVRYDYRKNDGHWEPQVREVFTNGNGAAVLLMNTATQKVMLTRQFRAPSYFNGNEDGMSLEVCAGRLDGEDPETAIKREIEEETGLHLSRVEKVLETYMSPGAVTELLHLFIAYYEDHDRKSLGGGAAHESEDIEVVEYAFAQAYALLKQGTIKDAKTVLLLQYALLHSIIPVPYENNL